MYFAIGFYKFGNGFWVQQAYLNKEANATPKRYSTAALHGFLRVLKLGMIEDIEDASYE